MPKIEVSIELPFFLRLEETVSLTYDTLCGAGLADLKSAAVVVSFSAVNRRTDRSARLWPRTTVTIEVDSRETLSEEAVSQFAILDCPKILNRIISCYQAATREVANSGCISPIGTSDMQLLADILVDGKDVRDRWPSHSVNTFPLPEEAVRQFEKYLRGNQLPLPTLFQTSAALLMERGQYSLSIVQAATAVELGLTQYIVQRLQEAGTPLREITQYEKKTLGQKLNIPKRDARSLETHFAGISEFPGLYARLKEPLNRLRVEVVHRGYLASLEEARDVVRIAREFLQLVAE